MGILQKILKQTAVYWPPASNQFDSFGKPVQSDPVEISCRWEDKTREDITEEGTRLVPDVRAFVGQDLEIGGVLMLGTLDDISEDYPLDNPGAYEIKTFEKIPDLRVKNFLRIARM